MSNKQQRNLLGGLARLASELNPVSFFTVLCALGITAFAAWDWLEESGEPRPRFPWYGAMAVSYAGGFLIGRVFWKVLKTAAIVAAIVLGGLALLNRVDVDILVGFCSWASRTCREEVFFAGFTLTTPFPRRTSSSGCSSNRPSEKRSSPV